MDFRILGSLEVRSDGRTVDLGGPKQRALLLALLLEANAPVAIDRLVDALWDDEPPDTASKALQIYVSQLRKAIGRDRVETQPPGYLVVVDADELDVQRFERLRAEGRHRDALALWRGPALADVADRRFAQSEISRLEELRLACLEDRLEEDLAAGRHREVVAELETLVRANPLRQRLCGQLMLALYRSGRDAEALAAYADARSRLVEELGIEPGRELRELQQRILRQDVDLDVDIADRDLPTGTVTFMFTDIEGSTARLDAVGTEAYAQELDRHRAIFRAAFERYGGVEVDTQGDALFAAFPTAPGAVAAALEAQRELAREPTRARVGLHTGTPHVTRTGYAGLDVHRGARIAAAAHGAQILASAATAELLGDAVGLRDLGRYRLKDLPDVEHLYQVGDGEFPPPRALHRTNLPVAATPFLGREAEVAAVRSLLEREDVRLLTLTGPGGTGKTRLALRAVEGAGDDLPGGVWWIPFPAVRDAELVLPTIAKALDVPLRPGQPVADAVAAALERAPIVLVLDSVEHLLPQFATELSSLPSLGQATVLVTSRERLRLAGEHVYVVTPMTPPDAVELFRARTAQRGVVVDDDESVAELCERLDHLPLAIELAAARAPLFTPRQLLERVSERLHLFVGGRDADPRQQTLQATMAWSYDLLVERERRLFARLAAFVGGCSYDAAEAVCDADPDTLQSLIEKSLLRRRDGDEPRYWMLETIREYATLRLGAEPDHDDVAARHTAYYLDLAERAGLELAEGDSTRWSWLDRLDADVANLRAMLRRLDEVGSDEERGRAAAALWRYWVSRDVGEGLSWLRQAAALSLPDVVRARVLHGLTAIAIRLGELEVAEDAARERIELHRRLGDDRGSAESQVLLGSVAAVGVELAPDVRAALESAVAYGREAGETTILAGALSTLGYVALREGRIDDALASSREAARLWRRLNRDDQVAVALINVASALVAAGELDRARTTLQRGLRLAVSLGDRDHVAYCLDGFAAADVAAHDFRRAALLLGAADAVRAAAGTRREPFEEEVNERTHATVREALGAEYLDAVLDGANRTLEDVVELVLEPEAEIAHDRGSL
ncbi:MAG TPA: BTAD domain-containing putative transcriptional regulator [Gaiellaceae bacterium]|nr:BTAD domain-containing putative transcriptional regulator [Gaiellaceae bacterium]